MDNNLLVASMVQMRNAIVGLDGAVITSPRKGRRATFPERS